MTLSTTAPATAGHRGKSSHIGKSGASSKSQPSSSTTSTSRSVSLSADAVTEASVATTNSTTTTYSPAHILLHQLRQLRQQAIERTSLESACFWAEKAKCLAEFLLQSGPHMSLTTAAGQESVAGGTGGKELRAKQQQAHMEVLRDTYALAKLFYQDRQFQRAISLLSTLNIAALEKPTVAVEFCHLHAKCLISLNRWQEALELLESLQESAVILSSASSCHGNVWSNVEQPVKTDALIFFLKGKIQQHLNNFTAAKESYLQALSLDARCFEALDAILSSRLLNANEEQKLFEEITPSTNDHRLAATVAYLYQSCRNFPTSRPLKTPKETIAVFAESPDILARKAMELCNRGYTKEAFEITCRVLAKDEFHQQCLPTHIACLYERKASTKLFYLAHRLVDNFPKSAVSWFAIGTYYLSIGKNTEARRYFSQATSLDDGYVYAWIGFAHTFALEGEHDQAIAAYSASARLFQGSHLAYLYMGMQHVQMHSLQVAEELLLQSKSIYEKDPQVYHELGVISYHRKRYQEAKGLFERAHQLASDLCYADTFMEPLMVNLGHACRELRNYSMAKACYQEAHRLAPENSATTIALGLAHHLTGELEEAITLYHQGLSENPDDTIATEMLNRALAESSKCRSFWDQLPADLHSVGEITVEGLNDQLLLVERGEVVAVEWEVNDEAQLDEASFQMDSITSAPGKGLFQRRLKLSDARQDDGESDGGLSRRSSRLAARTRGSSSSALEPFVLEDTEEEPEQGDGDDDMEVDDE